MLPVVIFPFSFLILLIWVPPFSSWWVWLMIFQFFFLSSQRTRSYFYWSLLLFHSCLFFFSQQRSHYLFTKASVGVGGGREGKTTQTSSLDCLGPFPTWRKFNIASMFSVMGTPSGLRSRERRWSEPSLCAPRVKSNSRSRASLQHSPFHPQIEPSGLEGNSKSSRAEAKMPKRPGVPDRKTPPPLFPKSNEGRT